jgi:hypothetical protein
MLEKQQKRQKHKKQHLLKYVFLLGVKYGKNENIAHMVPHPTTISNNITKVKAKHNDIFHAGLKKYASDGYGCMLDLWKEHYSNEAYFGVTISFIKEGQMICNTLAVKTMNHENTTSEKFPKKLRKFWMNEFNLDSFDSNAIMVTDRGANMLTKFGMYMSFVQHGSNSRY